MTVLGVPLEVRLVARDTDRFISLEVDDLEYASAVPGGYSMASFRLSRPLSIDPAELHWFTKCYIYDGRNGLTVFQGTLTDPGRLVASDGERWAVTVEGPVAHAHDKVVPWVYVDQNLERWLDYYLNSPGGRSEKQPTADVAATGRIKLSVGVNESALAGFARGYQYNGLRETGQHLARMAYSWDTGKTDANWNLRMRIGNGTLASLEDDVTWNVAGGTGGGVITTDWASTIDLTAFTIERFTSTDTPAAETAWAIFTDIILRGTIYGLGATELTAAADYANDYILASEVVKDLLGRLLPEWDVANASVAATSYQIKQLAYPDGASAYQILQDLLMLEPGYFWAVWEDGPGLKPAFTYQAWPAIVELEATTEDGFDSPGSTTDLYDKVNVRWRDILGRIRRTERTNTVPLLSDAGKTRTAFIDIADVMGDSLNADRVGDQFLAEHASPPNAGTLTVARPITNIEIGRTLQPWELPRHAPGKLIRVRDVLPRGDALNATGRDAVTVFRVVGARYNARDNVATLDLDSSPRTLDRLLSRMTMPDYSTWGWNSNQRRR